MKTIAAIVMCLTIISAADAQPPDPPRLSFFPKASRTTCQTWITERYKVDYSVARLAQERWMLGFIAGLDAGGNAANKTPIEQWLQFTEDEILEHVTIYCDAHPSDILWTAGLRVDADLIRTAYDRARMRLLEELDR